MAAKLYGADNAPLKIQFITDPHYYSRKGGTEGKAYEKAEAKSQKIIKDSDLVIKAGFDQVEYIELRDADTLLPATDQSLSQRLLAAAWLDGVRLIDNIPV